VITRVKSSNKLKIVIILCHVIIYKHKLCLHNLLYEFSVTSLLCKVLSHVTSKVPVTHVRPESISSTDKKWHILTTCVVLLSAVEKTQCKNPGKTGLSVQNWIGAFIFMPATNASSKFTKICSNMNSAFTDTMTDSWAGVKIMAAYKLAEKIQTNRSVCRAANMNRNTCRKVLYRESNFIWDLTTQVKIYREGKVKTPICSNPQTTKNTSIV